MVKGITAKEKFGYGMGEVASGVVFGLVQSVLQKYYTDILGIGVISIMMLFILARFWDAADDTIWGHIIAFLARKQHNIMYIFRVSNVYLSYMYRDI